MVTNHLLYPVYEFRPLPRDIKEHGGELYRYAGGKWVLDDGEYDLAFSIGVMHYYVDLPYHKNILWSWVTRHWGDYEPKHPQGNAWHYALRDGETTWGTSWAMGRHPNTIASCSSADFTCKQKSCANGAGPEFRIGDPYIKAGLVRRADTKEVVVFPENPVCMYCGLDWVKNG